MLRGLLLTLLLLCSGAPVWAQDFKLHAQDSVDAGWSSIQMGEMDTAMKRFNRALELDANFAPAFFGKAYVYNAQKRPDLAITNYRKSIEKAPYHADSYSQLGITLLRTGKAAEALPMLEKAIELEPANGDAQLNMARYFFEVANYAAAWKHVHLARAQQTPVTPEFLRNLAGKMPEQK